MYQLRNHASLRIGQRLRISEQEVLDILKYDICVTIHVEKGTNVVQKLFFSTPDKAWFVAVINIVTRQVITVTPFHRDEGSRVLLPQMLEAHRLMCGYEEQDCIHKEAWKLIFSSKTKPPRYKVFVRTQKTNGWLVTHKVFQFAGKLDVCDDDFLSRHSVVAIIENVVNDCIDTFPRFYDAYVTRGLRQFPIIIK